MKRFAINKFIEREPTIFGMKINTLVIFGAFLIIDGFIIYTFFSWILLLAGLALLAPLQLLINYVAEKKIINSLMHEKHPEQITNDIQ